MCHNNFFFFTSINKPLFPSVSFSLMFRNVLSLDISTLHMTFPAYSADFKRYWLVINLCLPIDVISCILKLGEVSFCTN